MPSPKKTPEPPPLPPSLIQNARVVAAPEPPTVASERPSGAFLVELVTYNGAPFKDHWQYFVRSHSSPDRGVVIHATGDVRNGFEIQMKRCHDFQDTVDIPMKRIPLQWVDGKYFDEKAMFNDEKYKIDDKPVCGFEASACKVKAPGKTLNDQANSGKSVRLKNCQTWIVESADQLVRDRIFDEEVAAYLYAIEQ